MEPKFRDSQPEKQHGITDEVGSKFDFPRHCTDNKVVVEKVAEAKAQPLALMSDLGLENLNQAEPGIAAT